MTIVEGRAGTRDKLSHVVTLEFLLRVIFFPLTSLKQRRLHHKTILMDVQTHQNPCEGNVNFKHAAARSPHSRRWRYGDRKIRRTYLKSPFEA
jgi:hypothetical protein